MKASSRSSVPRTRNLPASSRKMRSSLPERTHCWKPRWQVWYGAYLLGAPLRSGTQHPQNPMQHCSRVLPGTASTIRPRCGAKPVRSVSIGHR